MPGRKKASLLGLLAKIFQRIFFCWVFLLLFGEIFYASLLISLDNLLYVSFFSVFFPCFSILLLGGLVWVGLFPSRGPLGGN